MNKSLASLFFVCLFLSFPVKAQTAKSSALLNQMLDLPAPKAFAPETETVARKERPEEFYEDENIPPDDAPIEDLLAFLRDCGDHSCDCGGVLDGGDGF